MQSLVVAALVINSLQPLQVLPVPSGGESYRVAPYARDASFEYLGTSDGLYRAPRLATGPLERIAFAGEEISALAIDDGVLYVGKGLRHYAVWPEHTLVRSRDHGSTFESADAGLYDCIANVECGYLVPEQIVPDGDRLFIEAGGNLLVSADGGASWKHLVGIPSQSGKPTANSCPITFERFGETVLVGGECPLDNGFLRIGRLRPDLLGWSEEPQLVTAPEMENGNVQFIRNLGGGIVFAGIEGALLKSTDGGRSFRYVIHYDLEALDRYPYIAQFVVSSRDPRVMLVGGFDKKNLVGYLASSDDGGESWQDASPLVGADYVSLLAEDADGRLLIGLDGDTRFTLAEVVLGERAKKRRAVR
jgi:hypothetical protein